MTALILHQPDGERLGGLEIRRFVQKYMGIGLGISVAIHLMLLATYQITANLINRNAPPPMASFPIVMDLIPPPPLILPTDPYRITQPKPPSPIASIPKPVVDELPPDAPAISTQGDISKFLQQQFDSAMAGIGDNPIAITQPIPPEEVIPPSDKFIPREFEPHLVSMIQPEYPAIAKSAAVGGEVWVQFYVDENGEVRDVRIVKSVPTGLGFEEETIKAVKLWKFTPAIQDQHPVGVWVGQKIVFKIQ
jgi:protein TonB